MEELKEQKTDLVHHQIESDPIDCIDHDELKSKSKEELISIMMTMEEYHSGPLPHPRILNGYEEIIPGAAERILQMAENQASHRQKIENKVIDSNIKNSQSGIILAFILGMTGIIGGIISVILGFNTAGVLITGGSLAAIVGTFIYGTRSEKAERIEKSKDE